MPTLTTTVIAWNAEWQEYTVRRGRATFHTDDYADAVGTAATMAKGGPVVDRTPKSRRAARDAFVAARDALVAADAAAARAARAAARAADHAAAADYAAAADATARAADHATRAAAAVARAALLLQRARM